MFLTRVTRTLRRRLAGDDAGSAMVAVIGVVAVGLIVTAMLASTITNGLSHTTMTRAAVQSQASADAGIAVAQASLLRGTCAADAVPADADGDGAGMGYVSATEPAYEVEVEYRTVAGGIWIDGCPTTTAVEFRIVSGGEASSPGILASAGNNRKVEAVYETTPPATTTIEASGAAIYSYSSSGFGGSGTLVSVNGSTPDVHIRHGNVVCDGASGGVHNMIVADGDLTIEGSCSMTGNAWSSGRTTLSGSTDVGGNLVANGITFSGSAKVRGSAWSTGNVTMPGSSRLYCNLVVTRLNMSGSARIDGDTQLSGTVSKNGASSIGGLLRQNQSSLPPAPPAPAVPDWVDFDYDLADWEGFTEKVMTGNCNLVWWPPSNPVQEAVTDLAGAPGVIDARGCSGGFTLDGTTSVALTDDLVIIANKFNLSGSARFTASNDVNLWLITPDTVENGLPTCLSGSSFTVGGSFNISSNITSMIYTPCRVQIASATNWKGQVFAGQVSVHGAARLAYDPIGLPGVNLSTGVASGGSTSTGPAPVLKSTRNVNG